MAFGKEFWGRKHEQRRRPRKGETVS